MFTLITNTSILNQDLNQIIKAINPNLILLDEDEEGCGDDDRKKRPRTAFTAAQIKALEQEFERNKYLSVSKRLQLSKQLKLTETQVSSVFF